MRHSQSTICLSLVISLFISTAIVSNFATAEDDGTSKLDPESTGWLELDLEESTLEQASLPEAPISDQLRETGPGRLMKVCLQSDGHLEERVCVRYPTGREQLIGDAHLQFTADDRVVTEVRTDDTGQFVVADLAPGEYIATAALDSGLAEFTVRVAAYNESAHPGEMFLDATFSPTPELLPPETIVGVGELVCFECGKSCSFPECGGAICEDCGEYICGECMEEIVPCDICQEPPAACCGGCGGGGGGGGGLGWLGLAGLGAGITALSVDDNGNRPPASPVAP